MREPPTLPIRLLPTATKCGVRPFPGVEPVEGWRDRASRYSEQGAERVEGIEAPIESKRELRQRLRERQVFTGQDIHRFA